MVVDLEKVLKEIKELKKKKSKKEAKSFLKKKITSRQILKPSQMTITIKKTEPHSILREEGKFFKPIMEQEKRSMFFD